eukprot:scaffold92027_cov26-Tisochrysis_lutea.AAC.2
MLARRMRRTPGRDSPLSEPAASSREESLRCCKGRRQPQWARHLSPAVSDAHMTSRSNGGCEGLGRQAHRRRASENVAVG